MSYLSQKNLGYFIPYHYLDTLFLYLSIIGIVIGILIQHKIMFRNSIIFAMKFYPSSCIYSLYKKIGGHPITFSNYSQLIHHHTNPPPVIGNPAIRLARSDTEFEEASRKASNEFNKPRVSFQNVTEELQHSSMSEPTLSPRNIQQYESSILKPCFRKTNLQLPINSSYP
jgi:hypothetical protein